MSTSSFDTAALEQIKRLAGFDAAHTPAMKRKAEKTPEPAYVPPVREAGAGERLFSAVFGWTPTTVPDLPVRVFAPEDWSELIRPYIPGALPNGGLWTWPREATEVLALAMLAGDRTLIHGPTGSGKSALVEAWAHMCGIPLIRVNCHRDMQSTDFLGKDIITTENGLNVLKYEFSMTTIAAREGGLLLIDEAFRSPVLMAIQSLLERNGTLTLPDAASLSVADRKIVPPTGRFWIALTDNTNGTGDDSGSYNAEVQDLSTLSRITATIEVPYMSDAEQAALLVRSAPEVPSATIADLAAWAGRMRAAFLQKSVMQPVCMRVLLSVLSKYTITGNLRGAIKLAYTSKLGASDRTVAGEAYRQVTGDAL